MIPEVQLVARRREVAAGQILRRRRRSTRQVPSQPPKNTKRAVRKPRSAPCFWLFRVTGCSASTSDGATYTGPWG